MGPVPLSLSVPWLRVVNAEFSSSALFKGWVRSSVAWCLSELTPPGRETAPRQPATLRTVRVSVVPCALRPQNTIGEPAGVLHSTGAAGGAGALHGSDSAGFIWEGRTGGSGTEQPVTRLKRVWLVLGSEMPARAQGNSWHSLVERGLVPTVNGAVNLCERRLPFNSALRLWLCQREVVLSSVLPSAASFLLCPAR